MFDSLSLMLDLESLLNWLKHRENKFNQLILLGLNFFTFSPKLLSLFLHKFGSLKPQPAILGKFGHASPHST